MHSHLLQVLFCKSNDVIKLHKYCILAGEIIYDVIGYILFLFKLFEVDNMSLSLHQINQYAENFQLFEPVKTNNKACFRIIISVIIGWFNKIMIGITEGLSPIRSRSKHKREKPPLINKVKGLGRYKFPKFQESAEDDSTTGIHSVPIESSNKLKYKHLIYDIETVKKIKKKKILIEEEKKNFFKGFDRHNFNSLLCKRNDPPHLALKTQKKKKFKILPKTKLQPNRISIDEPKNLSISPPSGSEQNNKNSSTNLQFQGIKEVNASKMERTVKPPLHLKFKSIINCKESVSNDPNEAEPSSGKVNHIGEISDKKMLMIVVERFFLKERRKIMSKRLRRLPQVHHISHTIDQEEQQNIFKEQVDKIKKIFGPTYRLDDKEGERIRKRFRQKVSQEV
ncbi:unnamed protein product [Moneuplotes crassus]|uniref:Uncharacterized protein n=1 Tax=Euplotes crassus TaxID=5936 RepID=A0AAD1U381_EUPCR|nr:unnamed protein product [Moneuplotes crassus]